MKGLLFTILLLTLPLEQVHGQVQAGFNERGEMSWLKFNSSDFADKKFCNKLTVLEGTLADVTFNVDGRITDFYVKYKKKSKVAYWSLGFPEEFYEQLESREISRIPTLMREDNSVRVTFFTCGQKATLDIVSEIRRN